MPFTRSVPLFLASLLLPVAAGAAPIGFTLGDGGASLLRLGPIDGSGAPLSVAIRDSNGASISLTDIDFEKETGQLYGSSAANDAIYLINPTTGLATFRAGLPSASAADVIAIDWNNNIDRLRVVDTDTANFVFNQTNDTITQFTSLFYVPGDANAGATPEVFANAYRDSVASGGAPTAQGGTQLAIDAATGSLITLGNNAGTLGTVGSFGFDLTTQGGFDIFSTPDGMGGFADVGYAILTDAGTGITGLFQIALSADSSGMISTTLLRSFGANADIRGLAVIAAADAPAIPLPAPVFLLATAIAGLAGLKRFRRAA